jgi:DNA-binding NarL/FixJ family response regulator
MGQVLILDKKLAGLIHYCPNCGTLTRPAPDFLTMAELDVLASIGKGKSTSMIAKRRGVSVKSVDSVIGLLCEKLGIKRGGAENVMVMLAREALKLGLSQL